MQSNEEEEDPQVYENNDQVTQISPPKTIVKGKIYSYRALYNYPRQSEAELDLIAGDLVHVTNFEEHPWLVYRIVYT